MRHFAALLLAAVLLFFLLPGCGDKTVGQTFRYDISGVPDVLDPQLVSSSEELLFVENTFEGLLRKGENGQLLLGVAESYEIEGNTYTFHLREGLLWSDGKTPLTAQDFVFAFQRVVDPDTGCPNTSGFLCIKNAPAILEGRLSPEDLGVRAPDDHTFVVELSAPNSFFLETVASAAAMPCNEEFFLSTRGKYGLSIQNLLYNGPFQMYYWDPETRGSMKPNPHYYDTEHVTAGLVHIYFRFPESEKEGEEPVPVNEQIWQRFLNGTTDVAALSGEARQQAQQMGASTYEFQDTVWGLVFNTTTNTYGNEKIRRAMTLALDLSVLEDSQLGQGYSRADAIVPSSISPGGQSYRELAGENLRPAQNVELAQELLRQGLEELGVEKLSKTTILCPDTPGFAALLSQLQGQWKDTLLQFINLEPMPMEELEKWVQEGDFMMAMLPFQATGDSPQGVLSQFSQNGNGYYLCKEASLDTFLIQGFQSNSLEEAANRYAQAEAYLLEQGYFIPLFYETSYYACAPGVQGLRFSPFTYQVFFPYATKEG